MHSETLINFAAEIVSAHVSNNSVAPADLPRLIQSVYDALATAGQPAEVAPEVLTPAVSIRSSIKQDSIVCLECGAKFKALKRHLGSDHGLTPADYRRRWALAADYPMVSPAYSETRKQLALKIGLGRKPAPKVATKSATPRARKQLKLKI